jgi:hypothetical protein
VAHDTKLILRREVRQDTWGFVERASYDLDDIRAEFRKKLYSQQGLRLLKKAEEKSKKVG